MAEILLARIVGPSGFQRPVVIKRILPHLARQKDFVDMFLDEARIVSGIRHPNVVQVTELGHENDELFLVMEYLEGESTAGLMRRLSSRHEKLEPALAAYIVAEACAGAHAAHEQTDADGKNLEIVHRDLSPHNVFVTYGGAIKVLDFGIATAADKIAKTEAGQFKGKLEYASPEQCRGAVLDRRSDIFSLGTMLWELTTGFRLFKRPGAMEMLRAICEEPVPHPDTIDPEYPPELAAITMRALARKRRERYQTAAELRQDLLHAMRKLSTSMTLTEDLSEVMTKLFEARIEEKAEMLRSVQAGSTVTTVPVGETDAAVEIPVVAKGTYDSHPPASSTDTGSGGSHPQTTAAVVANTGDLSSPSESGVQPQRLRQIQMLPLLGGFGLLALCGIVLGALSVRARTQDPKDGMAPAASLASFVGTESATETSPASSTSTDPPMKITPAGPAVHGEAVIHVETSPPKAVVLINGTKKGTSPLDVHLPKNTAPVWIEIKHPGYVSIKERVVPDQNQKLRLTLQAERGPAAPPAAPGSSVPYHRFD
jgi:eukaryotic-like serine/threonine-protein kinase